MRVALDEPRGSPLWTLWYQDGCRCRPEIYASLLGFRRIVHSRLGISRDEVDGVPQKPLHAAVGSAKLLPLLDPSFPRRRVSVSDQSPTPGTFGRCLHTVWFDADRFLWVCHAFAQVS